MLDGQTVTQKHCHDDATPNDLQICTVWVRSLRAGFVVETET